MNNPAVNNEKIVQYLLGSLPEAETEHLDELSIIDDEFAVALIAAETDLVDAYVQGQLQGPTLEKFRSYYLASPLRREKLSFAESLETLGKKHLNSESQTGSEAVSAERPTGQGRSRWFSGKGFFTTSRLAWQWGFAAAAIAILVAGIWLLSENMRLRHQVSQTTINQKEPETDARELQNEIERQRQAVASTEQELARVRAEREQLKAKLGQGTPASDVANGERNGRNQQRPPTSRITIASFALMPQMRGVQQIPPISIPANTDRVAIALELEPNDFSAYRVALVDQSGHETFWRSRQLKARSTAGGIALRVTFPAILLRPQVYALRVTGVAPDAGSDIIGDYTFKVVKQ